MLLAQLVLSLLLWLGACSGIVEPPAPPNPPPPPAPAPPPSPPPAPPPNQPPVVGDEPDHEAVVQNQPYTYDLFASDPDGDALTFFVVHQPARGTVVMQPNGHVEYTPAPGDYTGGTHSGLSFTWRVTDQRDTSAIQTFHLSINAFPIARPDIYAGFPSGFPVHVAPPGVKQNDNDPNGDFTAVEWATLPLHGTITPPTPIPGVDVSGGFTYQSDPGFVGRDSASYFLTETTQNNPLISHTVWVLFVVVPPPPVSTYAS